MKLVFYVRVTFYTLYTKEEWETIANEFNEFWHFPNSILLCQKGSFYYGFNWKKVISQSNFSSISTPS